MGIRFENKKYATLDNYSGHPAQYCTKHIFLLLTFYASLNESIVESTPEKEWNGGILIIRTFELDFLLIELEDAIVRGHENSLNKWTFKIRILTTYYHLMFVEIIWNKLPVKLLST